MVKRSRLYLLRVSLWKSPNVLILDEPTNDLDIQTLILLEDYLDTFPGIVITVSHDRYFLDRVVNRIFAFEGNGVVQQYEGGFTDYALKAGEAAQCNLSVQDGIITSGSNADSAANRQIHLLMEVLKPAAVQPMTTTVQTGSGS